MRKNPKIVMTDEANAFLKSLPIQAQKKIAYNAMKVEQGMIDNEIYKKLEGSNIWELRTLFNGIKYRLFAFWDTDIDALVIATHGIIKKTQKTPDKEIEKAEAIRKEYFNNKDKNKQ
ncbi:type II toxin-antitoxin system RelE/ParE family toxin [Parabacteroides merdae]|uniref:type II toxin-antitoxin system RelE/ParE family toxin n=1 Tax=Parabacteroides merdae TaxID=46503 RepID=UPI001C027653|nr:type II toxin-antitoxin system RelE/ParE family toxin [Parabacteroides merdae]MBT9637511.1 type II toxin-antitoxin system RelE/ParE family toxin [Parabacteroides merdae]